MKIATLIKSVWIIGFWAIISIACEQEDCGSLSKPNYKVTDYDLITIKAGMDPLHNERSFSSDDATLVSDNATVHYEDAGFVAEPTTERIAMKSRPSFFTSAFACSPPEPSPTQKITSIEILSSSDFITANQTIPAGQDIKSFFGIGHPDVTSVSDYLSTPRVATDQWILFILTTAPSGQQQHEFKFTIKLDDGSEYSAFAKRINITP